MSDNKPKGYYKYILAVDCETTGLNFYGDDPSFDFKTKKEYQSISWGLIVASTKTLEPIEKLYVEIQWDQKSIWTEDAERIHGLSRKYLLENGITKSEAVLEIGDLLMKYWKPTEPICLLGHNVGAFDKYFLRRLFLSEGIRLNISARNVDSYSIGQGILGVFNSDDLFQIMCNKHRKEHNALEDAENSLTSIRKMRKIFEKCLEGKL